MKWLLRLPERCDVQMSGMQSLTAKDRQSRKIVHIANMGEEIETTPRQPIDIAISNLRVLRGVLPLQCGLRNKGLDKTIKVEA